MAVKTATKTTRGKAQGKAPATKAASKPAGRTAAPKTTAKAATGAKTTRTARAKTEPAKSTRAKAAPVKPAPKTPTSVSEKKAWSADRKINKKTGFTEGTISDKIGLALLKGGKSRVDIVNSMTDLPTETRNGTKFQAANVAATVEKQMLDMGFQVVQSYKLVPPKRGA